MSRQREQIIHHANQLGLTVVDLTWDPIRLGAEKGGLDGGWNVWLADGRFAIGLSLAEVLEDLTVLAAIVGEET